MSASGTSMLPLIWPGRPLKVTRVDSEELRPGDLVLYRNAARLIIHRFYARSGAFFMFKGDFRTRFDRPVASQAILGRVKPVITRPWLRRLWECANQALIRGLVQPLNRFLFR